MQKGYELPFFKALEAQGVVEFLDEDQFWYWLNSISHV
jgi:hypothetical protein